MVNELKVKRIKTEWEKITKEPLTLHRASPCGFYTRVTRKGFAKTPFMWSLSISE